MHYRLRYFRNSVSVALGTEHLGSKMIGGQVGVPVRHLSVSMPEDPLEGHWVTAAHDVPACERVPEVVEVEVIELGLE